MLFLLTGNFDVSGFSFYWLLGEQSSSKLYSIAITLNSYMLNYEEEGKWSWGLE